MHTRRLITLATLLVTLPIFAQHSATLSWTASADTGGTINVYRAASACTGTPVYTQIKTGVVAAGPYVDATVTTGTFCYYITAVVGGAESAPSNTVQLTVLPQAPQTLTGTAK